MQIKILFDSITLNKKFATGWGISYLINNKILFDTGEKFNFLIKNMQDMDTKVSDIEAVVISHDHWDHTGGLWGVLKQKPKLKIYACPGFSKRFKNKVKSYGGQLIEVDKFTLISKNIYSTGEIRGVYKSKYMPEQALVVKSSKGLVIFTGCAHPGIIKIIENVRQNVSDSIYLILGGFHLKAKRKKTVEFIVNGFKQLDIEKVAPSHCTGKTAVSIFKEKYGRNFVKTAVGELISV